MNTATRRIDPRGSARRSPTAGNRGQGSKWLHPTTRRRIYERDGYCCVWCGIGVAPLSRWAAFSGDSSYRDICADIDSGATVDHVVPRARGGSNEHTNLITCCSRCNAKRNHRSASAFAAELCRYGSYDAAYLMRRVRNAQRRKLPVISRAP